MLDSSAIDVHTEIFEGPLDLLLYLIKKDNLDIYDIPIAQITQEYLTYLDVMKELNLDTAGEFLLMAATLMQIKVKMLLPSQAEADQDQGPDPRVELAAKLSEYEKYKAAALLLDSKYEEHKDIFYRGSPKFSESDKVLNLEFFELVAAVKRAFDTIEDDGHTISSELFPIETRMEKIIALLGQREWILLDDVFKGEKKRMGVITCFMALLELIKQNKIFARQDNQFGEIRVYISRTSAEPEPVLQSEPEPAPQPVQLVEEEEADPDPLPIVSQTDLPEEPQGREQAPAEEPVQEQPQDAEETRETPAAEEQPASQETLSADIQQETAQTAEDYRTEQAQEPLPAPTEIEQPAEPQPEPAPEAQAEILPEPVTEQPQSAAPENTPDETRQETAADQPPEPPAQDNGEDRQPPQGAL